MANIGSPQRTIEVVPLNEPVPEPLPSAVPDPEPETVPTPEPTHD
jgi:hypothetical protein